MPQFEPQANEEFSLRIENQERHFRAMEHPNAPNMAHAMDGGKAKVFRVKDVNTADNYYALKLMKPKYRDPALEAICSDLDKLKTLPGLVVCERRCLSPAIAPEAIRQYKNLEYAILMPWIHGQSWFDALQLGKKGAYSLDKKQSLQLASNFARILSGLEREGIAHCDLSPGNIILDLSTLQIELIDVEDIFTPNFSRPGAVSLGTPGYQHKTSGRGQWNAKADRFAGAILLSEMLGWYDSNVWHASSGDSYFEPDELQTKNCQRYNVLEMAISAHNSDLIKLLERAWESETLDECPALHEWNQALGQVTMGYTFEPLAVNSSIGKKFSPFWASFTDLPTATQKKPVIQWGAPVGADPSSRHRGNPVEWEDVNPKPTQQNGASKPVEWLGAAKTSSDEAENGKTR